MIWFRKKHNNMYDWIFLLFHCRWLSCQWQYWFMLLFINSSKQLYYSQLSFLGGESSARKHTNHSIFIDPIFKVYCYDMTWMRKFLFAQFCEPSACNLLVIFVMYFNLISHVHILWLLAHSTISQFRGRKALYTICKNSDGTSRGYVLQFGNFTLVLGSSFKDWLLPEGCLWTYLGQKCPTELIESLSCDLMKMQLISLLWPDKKHLPMPTLLCWCFNIFIRI